MPGPLKGAETVAGEEDLHGTGVVIPLGTRGGSRWASIWRIPDDNILLRPSLAADYTGTDGVVRFGETAFGDDDRAAKLAVPYELG